MTASQMICKKLYACKRIEFFILNAALADAAFGKIAVIYGHVDEN